MSYKTYIQITEQDLRNMLLAKTIKLVIYTIVVFAAIITLYIMVFTVGNVNAKIWGSLLLLGIAWVFSHIRGKCIGEKENLEYEIRKAKYYDMPCREEAIARAKETAAEQGINVVVIPGKFERRLYDDEEPAPAENHKLGKLIKFPDLATK